MAEAELAGRRAFLSRISLALSAAAGAVVAVPIVAYLLSPLINPNPPEWIDVGSLDAFPVGSTRKVDVQDPSPLPWAGQTARTSLWLRRDGPSAFVAFAVNCTHLGCPVTWRPDASIFLCPCHGGVYYGDGTVAGGPPPRPLPRYDVRVEAGAVQIRTRPLPVA
jgi:menaquinol-cytochrome c reductase iron-sulfur subunit